MKKEELIEKWLNDSLSDEELKQFQALEDYTFYTEIVKDAQLFKAPDFNPSQTIDEFMASKMPPANTKRSKWYGHTLKAAGVVTLIITVYFLFSLNKAESYTTLTAETKVIALPDGSSVTLNAVSTLTYDPSTWNEKRELTLIGEALFDVMPGSDFEVNTSNGSIAVLGTIFNVKSRSETLNVACFEGIVRVNAGSNVKKLKAGETVEVFEKKLTFGTIFYENPGWIKGISRFSKTGIGEVIEELERQYDVKVKAINVDLTRKFTGAFSNNNLDSALQAITEPMNLHYTKTNDKEITVSKKEN